MKEMDPGLRKEGKGNRPTLLEETPPAGDVRVFLVDPDASLPDWDRDRHWQYTHAVFVARPTLARMVRLRVNDIDAVVVGLGDDWTELLAHV